MPTYQYKCKACEHRFDIVQKITEDSLTECPECGGEIRRVLFPAGVVFKGSGWYVTDYRKSGEKAKYEAEKKGETAPAASTSDTKTDSKVEGKTETKSDTKSETKTETKSESATPTSTPATTKAA